jgi:transcriptional regulator with XRE-family HTH domain
LYDKSGISASAGATNIGNQEQVILQDLLRNIRKEAGLSQQELANRLGKPQSFVSKYESGERRLDILEIFHICKAIGVPLADFSKRLEEALSGLPGNK